MKNLFVLTLTLLPTLTFAQTPTPTAAPSVLREATSEEKEVIANDYFTRLQLGSMDRIIAPGFQKELEVKFNTLYQGYKDNEVTHEEMKAEITTLCTMVDTSPVTLQNNWRMNQVLNAKILVPAEFSKEKPLFEQVYISWGYNRAWHTDTDVKFKTPDGTFTVHNTHSTDRPSPFNAKVYFTPSSLSIPQYNIEIGAMFNKKWGIELKQDHMKVIFDNTRPYEITGDYNHKVVVTNPHPTNEWDEQIPVDFSVAKANKDATWLGFEHSDGYNYVSLGAVYNQNLVQTKNEFFKIDARFGAGGGIIVPKTKVMMHQDQRWNWEGLDNKFHIAGGGAHAETKLRFTFWNKIYLQAAVRGTLIKVKDALVDGSSARMEHIQPIGSVQVMGQVGYVHTFKKKKK